MEDQIIKTNFDNLASTVNAHGVRNTARIEVLLELMDEIAPGTSDTFNQRMYYRKVLSTAITRRLVRSNGNVNSLEELKKIGEAMKMLKKEGDINGYQRIFDDAKEAADNAKIEQSEDGGPIEP